MVTNRHIIRIMQWKPVPSIIYSAIILSFIFVSPVRMPTIVRLLSALLITSLLPIASVAQSYPYPYQPYASAGITRAEFVRMTLDAVGGYAYDGTHCFTDVTTQYFAPQVCAAKQRGIIAGHPDGRFLPDTSVSFVEAAAIVVRAKGTVVAGGFPWYMPYVQKLADWNAIPVSVRSIFEPLSSFQAREILTEALNEEVNGTDDDDDDSDDDRVHVSNSEMRLTVSGLERADRGDRVTFTITIENRDDRDIRPDIRAELDDDMTFVSAMRGGDDDDDIVEWDNFRVREDATEEIELTVRIRSNATLGNTLRLRVEADDLGVTKGITVGDPLDEDDLRLTITDSDDPVERLSTVTYRIRMQNRSNDDITIDVRAILDRGMDYVSSTDGGTLEDDDEVEWEDIEIEEDETKTILLTVRLNSRARDGDTLRLRVDAAGLTDTETTKVDDDDDDDRDDDEWDVTISITDSPDPAEVGDIVRYRIAVRNRENRDISLDIIAEIDEGMTYYSSTRNGRKSGDEVRWENIDIDEDDTELFLLDVRINGDVDDGDTVRLRVEAGNDTDTETTRIED